jgi:exopolyphosphatase/guanosine-5'-triphosphate,3'-diphosphate pyrophosphatase
MRVGVIDLGTNTFNILIVEKTKSNPFNKLLNTKLPVMLGKEGINNGNISQKAYDRAFKVLTEYKKLLDKYKCDKVTALGTSALRSANNADVFINRVKKELGIDIELISGEQEAEYIYNGIKQSIQFTDENYLILDIGGGSNEFIIANKDKMLWKHSFPLGGARLLEKFTPEDIISQNTIDNINKYLTEELQLLIDVLVKHPVTKLVGASGAFDTFADILSYIKTDTAVSQHITDSVISIEEFDEIYNMVVKSSRKERILIKGLDEPRVDIIVIALIFTKLTLKLANINEILQSTYSLKEGVAILQLK